MTSNIDPSVAWLIDHFIDDLTKYNIVRFLHERPEFRGDLTALATGAGLERTKQLFEAVRELVSAAFVSTEPDDGGMVYSTGLAGERRELVAKLLEVPAESAQFSEVMRRLTAHSLQKVMRRFSNESAIVEA